MPDIELIIKDIRERHFEQLRELNLVEDPTDRLPLSAGLGDLIQWTTASTTQIENGVRKSVFSGPPGTPNRLNFDNALTAFMESAAMYLRDTSKVVEAVETYRRTKNLKEAMQLFQKSTADIDILADMWGMRFVPICDILTLNRDGHSWTVGPFCGAFIPKIFTVGHGPIFIGIAFKGTNVSEQVINDLSNMSTIYASGLLWGSQVSKDFYYPIFSTYNQRPRDIPLTLIQNAIWAFEHTAAQRPIIHVTGHSLGAAYGTLLYAQLLIQGFSGRNSYLGDLYTFGSPRVGRGDFARPFRDQYSAAGIGSKWRFVNNEDFLTKVPASLPFPFSRDPFIHTDAACEIYPDKVPTLLPSEIGTHPTASVPTAIAPHCTTAYYRSLKYAATSREAPRSKIPLTSFPALAPYTLSPDEKIPTLTTSDVFTPTISLDVIQDCVVGTIKYECFVGEIIALGDIGKLNRNPEFHYNASDSWKSLYAKDNQLIFTKKDKETLEIGFVVDGVQVAWALVSTELGGDIGDVLPTRGTCHWSFCEGEKVNNVLKSVADSAASIFN